MALDLWWEILLVAVASVVGCYCCSLVVWNSVYPDDENPARNDVENPAWEGRDDSDVENQLVEFVPTRKLAAYGFLPGDHIVREDFAYDHHAIFIEGSEDMATSAVTVRKPSCPPHCIVVVQ